MREQLALPTGFSDQLVWLYDVGEVDDPFTVESAAPVWSEIGRRLTEARPQDEAGLELGMAGAWLEAMWERSRSPLRKRHAAAVEERLGQVAEEGMRRLDRVSLDPSDRVRALAALAWIGLAQHIGAAAGDRSLLSERIARAWRARAQDWIPDEALRRRPLAGVMGQMGVTLMRLYGVPDSELPPGFLPPEHFERPVEGLPSEVDWLLDHVGVDPLILIFETGEAPRSWRKHAYKRALDEDAELPVRERLALLRAVLPTRISLIAR